MKSVCRGQASPISVAISIQSALKQGRHYVPVVRKPAVPGYVLVLFWNIGTHTTLSSSFTLQYLLGDCSLRLDLSGLVLALQVVSTDGWYTWAQ